MPLMLIVVCIKILRTISTAYRGLRHYCGSHVHGYLKTSRDVECLSDEQTHVVEFRFEFSAGQAVGPSETKAQGSSHSALHTGHKKQQKNPDVRNSTKNHAKRKRRRSGKDRGRSVSSCLGDDKISPVSPGTDDASLQGEGSSRMSRQVMNGWSQSGG